MVPALVNGIAVSNFTLNEILIAYGAKLPDIFPVSRGLPDLAEEFAGLQFNIVALADNYIVRGAAGKTGGGQRADVAADPDSAGIRGATTCRTYRRFKAAYKAHSYFIGRLG